MGSLAADLEKLKSYAFHQAEYSADLVKRLHGLLRKSKSNPDALLLERLYHWLLCPVSLWPVNLDVIGRHVEKTLRQRGRLDECTYSLLSMLGAPPKESVQIAVARHEHEVRAGNYDSVIHADYKFNYKEQALLNDAAFVQDWKRIKTLFDVKKYQDHKRLIRRQMVQERDFRPDWDIDWKKDEDRFRSVFNAFCLKWNLYGMEGDRPLLLKLTVNLTPFGTMIFIPAYWSFDYKRDLKPKSLAALHKARGVERQGPKLGPNKLSRQEEAERVKSLWDLATKSAMKGKARTHWVMGQMGWHPGTDESRLKRLLKMK